jgi:hypothetical protein
MGRASSGQLCQTVALVECAAAACDAPHSAFRLQLDQSGCRDILGKSKPSLSHLGPAKELLLKNEFSAAV